MQPCGTTAAYRRHLRRGEKACPACLAANTLRSRGGKPLQLPRELAPCGTLAAYRRHRRHSEPPCRACKDAYNEWKRKWREKMSRVSYSVSSCSRHFPVQEENRKNRLFWECMHCGAFLCWWKYGDTQEKVMKRIR